MQGNAVTPEMTALVATKAPKCTSFGKADANQKKHLLGPPDMVHGAFNFDEMQLDFGNTMQCT